MVRAVLHTLLLIAAPAAAKKRDPAVVENEDEGLVRLQLEDDAAAQAWLFKPNIDMEEGDGKVDRALDAQADPDLGPDAPAAELPGDVMHSIHQLAMAQLRNRIAHRDRLGRPRRAPGHEVVQTDLRDPQVFGDEIVEQVPALGLGEVFFVDEVELAERVQRR